MNDVTITPIAGELDRANVGATSTAEDAIVTVADRWYLPPACCQLISTASHVDAGSEAQLFLILCDVSDEDVKNARCFFEKRELTVEIILANFVDKMPAPLQTRFPTAAYLRLYLDWIFNRRWRRILYLDADTRVCAPLSPLLQANLRGQPIGAVHDFIYYVTGNIHRRRRDLGLASGAPYFQSGMLVFDWQKMHACEGLAAARRFLVERPDACYEAPDQDALNGTFENRWAPLDPRWNLGHLYLMFGGKLQPNIMHFTSTKPWSRERPRAWRRAAQWYQRELADSAWPDFVEPQSLWDIARVEFGGGLNLYSPRLRETIERKLPILRKLLGWNPWPDRFGYMPWVPRRTQDVEDMMAALIKAVETSTPLQPPESALANGHW